MTDRPLKGVNLGIAIGVANYIFVQLLIWITS